MVAKAFRSPEAARKHFTVFAPEAYTFKEAFEIFIKKARPESKIKQLNLGLMTFFSKFSSHKEFRLILQLMNYFNKTQEQGNPEEANKLLGAPETTLEKWCEEYKKTLKNE